MIYKIKKYEIIIDDEDFDKINKYRWACSIHKKGRIYFYARPENISMHRLIMGFPNGMDVDHINSNWLDNRKSNLRICSRSQNNYNNRMSIRNRSGLKGVCWDKEHGKWRAQIKIGNKQKYLGLFKNKEDAWKVYKKEVIEVRGEYVNLKGGCIS